LIFANDKNLVGKILGSQLFVGIGLISYSTYLWHQPLLTFARLRSIDELPHSILLIILCFSSLVLGYLSWKFVESPFRDKNKVKNKSLLLLSIFFSTFFILIGLVIFKNKGFSSRLSKQDKAIAEWQNYDYNQTLMRYQCFMESENTYLEFKRECFGEYNSNAYLIWGDSYAASSSKGLRAVHKNVIQLTASGCPPLIDSIFSDRPNCLKINEFIKEKIKEKKPEKIFLQANWHIYTKENVVGNLHKTIEFIKRESPKSKIIILGSVPQWEPSLPKVLIRKQLSLNQIEYVHISFYNELIRVDKELIALANEENINFVSILDNFCIEKKCLAITNYNSKFWLTTWDNGHLTEAGSVFLFTKLRNIIKTD